RGSMRSRLLSPREAARLMGAPDFWLPNNYNQAYRAMGDAVAVPVVRHLANHLLTPLAQAARCLPDAEASMNGFDHLYDRSNSRADAWRRHAPKAARAVAEVSK